MSEHWGEGLSTGWRLNMPPIDRFVVAPDVPQEMRDALALHYPVSVSSWVSRGQILAFGKATKIAKLITESSERGLAPNGEP